MAHLLQLMVLILFLQVLLLWLYDRRATTLLELFEAVDSTSAAAGTLQQWIEMARFDGQQYCVVEYVVFIHWYFVVVTLTLL